METENSPLHFITSRPLASWPWKAFVLWIAEVSFSRCLGYQPQAILALGGRTYTSKAPSATSAAAPPGLPPASGLLALDLPLGHWAKLPF